MRLIILGAIVALFWLQTPPQQQRTASIEGGNATTKDGFGGITEIILERTRCYGTCPIDTLALHSDGTAFYTGNVNTELSGQFAGSFRKAISRSWESGWFRKAFLNSKAAMAGPTLTAPHR
jgi:hypothetical protein